MSCSGPGTSDAVGYPHDPVYDRSAPLSQPKVVFQYSMGSTCPGKTLVGLQVKFPPKASTPPHHHCGCSVTGYVIKGPMLNKMNDEAVKIVATGGSWHEAPGCRHKLSENPSDTESAEILAIMIVDTKALEEKGMGALLELEPEYSDLAAKLAGK